MYSLNASSRRNPSTKLTSWHDPHSPGRGSWKKPRASACTGAAGSFRIGLQVEIAALDRPSQLVVPARAEHRVVQAPLDQRQPSADLAVGLVLPVTDDAGHPFARGWVPVEGRHERRLFQVHAHGRVAADGEVAVGAVGQLVDLRLHVVEHGAELRVGVYRNGPFAVDIGVTARTWSPTGTAPRRTAPHGCHQRSRLRPTVPRQLSVPTLPAAPRPRRWPVWRGRSRAPPRSDPRPPRGRCLRALRPQGPARTNASADSPTTSPPHLHELRPVADRCQATPNPELATSGKSRTCSEQPPPGRGSGWWPQYR